MPIEPVSIAASSDRMSPNMLPVTTTSNFLGALTSCMAALSTYMWSSSTSGYCGVHLGDHVLPELEGLQHVGLVDAGDLLAALARAWKATWAMRSISGRL
jgi:hypothetical protein